MEGEFVAKNHTGAREQIISLAHVWLSDLPAFHVGQWISRYWYLNYKATQLERRDVFCRSSEVFLVRVTQLKSSHEDRVLTGPFRLLNSIAFDLMSTVFLVSVCLEKWRPLTAEYMIINETLVAICSEKEPFVLVSGVNQMWEPNVLTLGLYCFCITQHNLQNQVLVVMVQNCSFSIQ